MKENIVLQCEHSRAWATMTKKERRKEGLRTKKMLRKDYSKAQEELSCPWFEV